MPSDASGPEPATSTASGVPAPRSGPRRLAIGFVAVVLLAGVGLFALRREIVPESTPASRGREVARRAGCFGCHGEAPGGAAPNTLLTSGGARTLGTDPGGPRVPSMFGGTDLDELRDWVERGSAAARAGETRAVIPMPGFGERLSSTEIDDVVAFLRLHAPPRDPEPPAPGGRPAPPEDPRAMWVRGEALARGLGCFACHGELGQGGVGNPGALKGYVPGFAGADFAALTREGDPGWVRAWISDGAPAAFLEQGFLGLRPARYFVERQAIRMPAYGAFLREGELDLLARFCLAVHARGPLDGSAIDALRRELEPPPPRGE